MSPTELSPEARRLLDVARGGDEPSPADRTRVRSALFAQIGATGLATPLGGSGTSAGTGAAGTSSAGTSSAATSSAGASASGLGVGAKLAIAAVLAGGIGAGGYAALRDGDATPAATIPAIAISAPAGEREALPAPAAPTASAPAAAPIATTAPATSSDQPDTKAARPGHTEHGETRAAPAAPSVASIKDEQALLSRASAALRGGDAAAALALLDQHARTFPAGALVEERSGARILALCALGRTAEAGKATARFHARWPKSILAARIRSACPSEP